MECHHLQEAFWGTSSLLLTGTWLAPCLFSGQKILVLPPVWSLMHTILALQKHLVWIRMLVPKQGTPLRSDSQDEQSRALDRGLQTPCPEPFPLSRASSNDESTTERQQLIQRRP